MTIDLESIAECLDRDRAQLGENIRQCGCKWPPAYVAQLQADSESIAACSAKLRRPGLTNDEALASISAMAREILSHG